MKLDIGETVICSLEVKDDAGAYFDPATSMNIVINRLIPFAAIITSTAMSKDSTGKYHYDFQTSSSEISKGKYQAIYTATDGTRITIEKEEFELQ